MSTRSAVLLAFPPPPSRRRGGPAAWVSHCVRAPTLTPGTRRRRLVAPDQSPRPLPDVSPAVGPARAWARVGYGGTPVDVFRPRHLLPGAASSRPVRGVSPYPENWAKRAGARRTDIVPRR